MSSVLPNTPETIDWATIDLPDAWPDQIGWRRPRQLWRLFAGLISGRPRRVELPPDLPGREHLPRYLLQEFHHLPNGNFSKFISRGYINHFDHVMLGCLHQARRQIARRLADAKRVIDIGCGGGQLSAVLASNQGAEVWALEPSPYLLQHAASKIPDLHCVQGIIEQTDFPEGYFDAAGACFVFHEIPPRYADQALTELRRILKPGALLAIVEPAPEQLSLSFAGMWHHYGWRGVYFRLLALRVFEPFVLAWQARDHAAWFEQYGFELIEKRSHMPYALFVARRRD